MADLMQGDLGVSDSKKAKVNAVAETLLSGREDAAERLDAKSQRKPKPARKRRNYVAELNALQGLVKTVLKILGCVEGDLPANVVAIVKGCLEGE